MIELNLDDTHMNNELDKIHRHLQRQYIGIDNGVRLYKWKQCIRFVLVCQ